MLVENAALTVVDWPADWYQCIRLRVGDHLVARGVDRGFRRAVKISEAKRRQQSAHLRGKGRVQCLAPADQVPQAGACRERAVAHGNTNGGRHHLRDRDAQPTHFHRNRPDVAMRLRIGDDHGRTDYQRSEQLGHRGIEADRCVLQHAVAGGHVHARREPECVIAERPMRDHHAVGPARGT